MEFLHGLCVITIVHTLAAASPRPDFVFFSPFTVVLSPNMPFHQIGLYGLWMMVIQMLWFSLVALLLSRPSVYRMFRRCGHRGDRILGGATVALGLKMLVTKTS